MRSGPCGQRAFDPAKQSVDAVRLVAIVVVQAQRRLVQIGVMGFGETQSWAPTYGRLNSAHTLSIPRGCATADAGSPGPGRKAEDDESVCM